MLNKATETGFSAQVPEALYEILFNPREIMGLEAQVYVGYDHECLSLLVK